MTTTHSADCRCANCRALRAVRNVDTPQSPGKPLDMGLDPRPRAVGARTNSRTDFGNSKRPVRIRNRG